MIPSPLLFWICAALAVVSATLVVLRRHPIHSALWLAITLLSTSVLYLSLQASFVAAMQIMVYAGAILVLILFVIMLLNPDPDPASPKSAAVPRVPPLALALVFGILCTKILWIGGVVDFSAVARGFGGAQAVGRLLFSEYVVPFEIVSLLLLTALVGAVVLGRRPES
jgi:NADH-quinone oxidoreductase subunit J